MLTSFELHLINLFDMFSISDHFIFFAFASPTAALINKFDFCISFREYKVYFAPKRIWIFQNIVVQRTRSNTRSMKPHMRHKRLIRQVTYNNGTIAQF
ncbi:MAG: hypothetical protein MHMPM18_001832 [Marteilia pararefringens]